MQDFNWKPIEPLSDKEREIDLAATNALYETWWDARKRLEESSSENLTAFIGRLVRRLSVETGILERLYDLDRGTTEALITRGFIEELVARTNTDIEPSRLIDILRDQESAIQLVMDCVAGNRDFTKGFMHDLHVMLTQHQNTTTAVDQHGNRREIALARGTFKEQPNNPRRPEGTIHEYCPPIHVESEIENLLNWLDDYKDEDPIVVATWFHHRFTQIHPYQDGNGRVARALTTLILMRANLLPLVIDRDMRAEYLDALESADLGELTPLATLFARLERAAILEALSVDADTDIDQAHKLTTAVIANLAAKFNRKREVHDTKLRKVNAVAKELRQQSRGDLEQSFSQLKDSLAVISPSEVHISDGGPDHETAHWYRFEVTQTAKQAGKSANFDEDHYFVKASFRFERERLVFVTSFHHVGSDLSGIMEATAFARLETFEDSDDRKHIEHEFFPCALEPFVFTYNTKIEEIQAAYGNWLDSAIAIALKEYGDRL
ncbi:MAG: Fic family protein [Rhodospirillaceae bacterium]|jgi:Fic family protein|nr:Fic family protein [Rhodospirillales bacterium]MBT3905842.1 Fic family protein [Rhodospirillaceae bacterium]MBT4700124.1 Fic family protein [Rhodospirillaceae bacterium]MBT5035128.1 Fic family protein [Rhodospirillaceae bacterium]MBT6221147.1 Fic family protein [Rhodospirillaceae bacterium]